MKKKGTPRPTNSELTILAILWRRGSSTVREVKEELDRAKPTGYTTALKLLQIMTEKGLVKRDESRKTHVYEPSYSPYHTQRQLMQDLLDRVFDGSKARLVNALFDEKDQISEDDFMRLREEIVKLRQKEE